MNGKIKKLFTGKKCKNCGFVLDKIHFTAVMTEEWTFNGGRWEQTAHNSLVTDREQKVFCPECSVEV